MDRGAWWATVHRVAKSQTILQRPSVHARAHTHTHTHTHTQTHTAIPTDIPESDPQQTASRKRGRSILQPEGNESCQHSVSWKRTPNPRWEPRPWLTPYFNLVKRWVENPAMPCPDFWSTETMRWLISYFFKVLGRPCSNPWLGN